MANIRTHYDNLKVTRDAPVSVIKAAYKALCQTFHPDKFQGSNEEAERIMRLVNASYAVLIDPDKRASHNAWIREQEAQAKQHGEKPQADETQQHQQQRQDTQEHPPTGANAEAMFQRAYDLNDQGRYSEAFSLYQQLAELGDAKAQFQIGVMYDRGQYVAQNYTHAVSWYRKAAEQGNANAQYNLALKYQAGQGVLQDNTKAAFWYRKAAEGDAKE